MTNFDLTELLDACRAGDALAWEGLVRQFQGRVFGLSYHLLGRVEDAQDVAQEAFVKVYRSLRDLPSGADFVPWLLAVTRNASLDHLRRHRARPQTSDLPEGALEALRDPASGPEASAQALQRRRHLLQALRKLAAPSRDVVVLKDLHGLSVEEVAGILDVPVGTVKSRASRARLELAEHLAAQWEGACARI